MDIKNFRLSSAILSTAGLIDSIYLTWIKIAENPALCIKGLGNCWTVNTSKYSELLGIPISIFGALTYGAILLLVFWVNKSGFVAENATFAIFGLSLLGTLYSIYLTYIEIAVIKAICPFCITSALIITVILVLTIIRLVKTQET